MAEPRPVIHVVDDDEAVRDSLRMLLESVGYDANTYASANEFLETHDPSTPGCIILDIRMPGMSGLELQEALRERNSGLPVIFVTGHGDIPMAVQAIQRGAADFLQKPFRDQELLDVIRSTLNDNIKQRDDEERKRDVLARIAALTPREREVLDRVVDGQPNKVIAVELGVSQRTVEIHRARVMEKMQANSLAELVRLVLLAGD